MTAVFFGTFNRSISQLNSKLAINQFFLLNNTLMYREACEVDQDCDRVTKMCFGSPSSKGTYVCLKLFNLFIFVIFVQTNFILNNGHINNNSSYTVMLREGQVVDVGRLGGPLFTCMRLGLRRT